MDTETIKHIITQYLMTSDDTYKSIADTIQGINNYNYTMALTQHALSCKRTETKHYACDYWKNIPDAVFPLNYDAPDGASYSIQFTIKGCRDFHLYASINGSEPAIVAPNIIQDR